MNVFNGNIYIGGSFYTDLIFPGDTTLYSDYHDTYFIVKYSSDGSIQWIKSIPEHLKLTSFSVIDEDKLYLEGTLVAGIEDFDNFRIGSVIDNLLLARLGGQEIILSTNNLSSFPESVTNPNILKVFPNPSTHQATIQFNNPDNERFKLILVGLSGKIMMQINNISGTEYILDRDGLPAGIYILELRGKQIYRGKLIFR